MRTFCLTLPETPDRTEKAIAHFADVGFTGVEFFYGIHAECFGLRTIFPYEVDNPGSGFNMGAKPTGIWLSHYALWMALNLLPDEHFLILEVDVKFPKDWAQRMDEAIKNTPKNFDMLYIGSCCCEGHSKIRVSGDVWETNRPQCNHAYIVAKKALPVMLSTQRKIYAPIDISLLFHTLPLLRVFAVLPRIADQFDTEIAP